MSTLDVFEPIDSRDARLALSAAGPLASFNAAGVLTAADVHVARTIARAAREQDEAAVLAAAFATRAVRLGSVAVDLAALSPAGRAQAPAGSAADEQNSPRGATDLLAQLPWPDAGTWLSRVHHSKLVAQQALVVEHGLVYLQRYHHQEVQVVQDLLTRAGGAPPAVREEVLRAGLDRYFADGDGDQRTAASLAVRSWTSVVTGGPGTGKTTTAATILALLAEQGSVAPKAIGAADRGSRGAGAGPGGPDDTGGPGGPQSASAIGTVARQRPLRIGLAAPTGKAAARMTEALRFALDGTPERGGIVAATAGCDPTTREAVAALRDLEAVTLHRLLGVRPDNRTRFRHHRGNRLPHDVVLVDEASMVSLTHMARLLEALRPTSRLILLGDPDQLVSVDAGAVLADLVAGAEAAATPPQRPGSAGPAGDGPVSGTPGGSTPVALARLRRVYRYGAQIGGLAEALRQGDADEVVAILRASRGAGHDAQVLWLDDPDPAAALEGLLTRQARTVYERAHAGDAVGALAAAGRHRLLCAHREGPFGVRTWNARIEAWLREATGDGLYDPMYVGRPLLITANDYATGVVNGDTGVIVAADALDGRDAHGSPGTPAGAGGPHTHGSRRSRRLAVITGQASTVAGESSDAAHPVTDYRVFAPSRLGDVQTLYAMTVHKSQGSQAESVSVLLPEEDSPLLTRELLYTGLTRARRQVRVVGSEAVVRAAVARRVVRASGLRARLASANGRGSADGAGP